MRRRQTGSGITKRTVVEFDSHAEFDTYHRHNPLLSFSQGVKKIVQEAKEVLQRRGVDPNISRGRHLTLERDGYELDSDVGYAVRLTEIAEELKQALSRDLTERAASAAFRLGSLLKESKMKKRWEQAALDGDKRLSGSRKYHAEKAKQIDAAHRRWELINAKLDPALTNNSERARRIAKTLGTPDLWKKIRKYPFFKK
jgi:hypothetical protein